MVSRSFPTVLDNEKVRQPPNSDEEASLLDGHGNHDEHSPRRRGSTARSSFGSGLAFILHGCLIVLYSSLALVVMLRTTQPKPLIASPASTALEYERRTFFPVTYENPFTGDPRPELDAAWHNLLQYAHVRVSKDELDAANYTSLPMRDGSGYVAQLASTHQLHCIKQIRHYLHREHYLPNATADELKAQGMHVDHCLEVLRLSTMCGGDVSLTPFYFATTKEGLYYPFVKSRTYHQCANWDRIQEWAKSRAVNLFDPGLLELPPGAKLLLQPMPSMVLLE